MQKIKLGDVAEYINGYAFKPTDWSENGYMIIRIQDLTGSDYQTNKFNGEIDSKYEVNNGDILISWSATLGIYVWNKGKAYLNQHIFKVVLNTEIVDKCYFYYQVDNLLKRAQSEAHGATMKHLTKEVFNNLPFLLPSLLEQKYIAKLLGRLDELIDKRKQQLESLDKLIKSQFIEMFGNYSLRNRQPDWVAIGTVAEVVGGSTPKTDRQDYWGGQYNWITPAEIKEDDFIIYDTQRHLTEMGVKSCSLRCLPVGTVLLSSRAPIGKVAIAGVEMYCNQGFKNLICSDKLNPIFAYVLLKYNADYFNSLGRGATFKEISKSIVENIYIPLPAINQQNKFACFVEQTDKSKFTIKQSLEQLEILKKSLMQKYFG